MLSELDKANPDLLSAFEALWSAPPIAIPIRGLRLRRLFQRPAKRPGKRAEAHYLAAWYQTEQSDLAAAAWGDNNRPEESVGIERRKALRERPLDSRL
jgi:hypothetical protein